jgi:hypothetical protein
MDLPGRPILQLGIWSTTKSSEVRVVSNSSTTDVLITRPPLGRGDYTMRRVHRLCRSYKRSKPNPTSIACIWTHSRRARCDFRRPHTSVAQCNTNYQTANRCTVIDPHDTSKPAMIVEPHCQMGAVNCQHGLLNAATRHCVAMPKIQKTNR